MLAARRVGIRDVALPWQNEKNIKEDISEDLRRDMTVHFVTTIDEVLALALQPAAAPRRPTGTEPRPEPVASTP